MAIHFSGQTVFSLTHIERITLGASEEVAGRASGMDLDRIGEVGDQASEGQAAGVYGAGFTAGSLARKGAKIGTRGMGNKVSSDKELMEVGRMAEGDRGGEGRKLHVEGSDKRMW